MKCLTNELTLHGKFVPVCRGRYVTTEPNDHNVNVVTSCTVSMADTLRCLDLFCGLGGFSAAFEDSDRWDLTTVDINERFNPDIVADVFELRPSDLEEDFDVVLASPPCTSFSLAANGHHTHFQDDEPLTGRGKGRRRARLPHTRADQRDRPRVLGRREPPRKTTARNRAACWHGHTVPVRLRLAKTDRPLGPTPADAVVPPLPPWGRLSRRRRFGVRHGRRDYTRARPRSPGEAAIRPVRGDPRRRRDGR